MKTTFETVSKYKGENFNFIRLMAAILVIYSHSFPLTGNGGDFFAKWGTSGGDLGVRIFFITSGFLITKSYDSRPSIDTFLKARFLRLFPALAVCILISVLVFSGLSTLSAKDYLLNGETKQYILNNLAFNTQYTLPGLFKEITYPNSVNGSLWTLPHEIVCYLVILVAGLIGALKKPALFLIVVGLLFIGIFTRTLDLGYLVHKVPEIGNLFSCFGLGAFLYVIRESVPYTKKWFVFSIILALIGLTYQNSAILNVSLCYCIIYFGYAKGCGLSFFDKFDASYGTYLYAFPIQQSVSWAINTKSPAAMMAIAIPSSVLLGLLSWFLIEKPLLKFKPLPTPSPEPTNTHSEH